MTSVDINCDMGEGLGNEELIMPYISSANIACGFHAGDQDTMWRVMKLATKYNVNAGAHPAYKDREHFGRIEMDAGLDDIYEWIMQQLLAFHEIASPAGIEMKHVKPHGALYNLSARDPDVAATIARAVEEFDHELILFGMSGSHSIEEAKKLGLRTASEVFADRNYLDDGSLVPRSEPGALIRDTASAVEHVLQMVTKGTVVTITDNILPIEVDTICIHGDGENAVEFARAINESLKQNNIAIKAL